MVLNELDKYKSVFISNINQIPGYRTRRKIVVFESDDWGSCRMPSVKTYETLLKKGFILNEHYNKFDSLESATDLSALFDLLTNYQDSNGNPPAITANFLVANPDFEKISASNFAVYFYKIFTESYKYEKECEESFSLLQQGMMANIFKPQFHGREHLNINLWMKALQSNHRESMIAFENRFWGHRTSFQSANRHHFLSAFDLQGLNELSFLQEVVKDGLGIFKSVFGYNSQSFIATNYTWHPGIEKALFENGVKFIQGHRWQLVPLPGHLQLSKKWRFMGQYNNMGQIQLVRNAYFEPSENPNLDWAGNCLKEIKNAFFWRKPAIISCHRVNFIGSIDVKNRDRNLLVLKQLLKEVLRRWPDVEFMSTDQLGELIAEKN